MRVAVIGAGVIGVTTAYELGADGHEVTVFERRGSVAAETSFANAGLVAPGYVTPWAAPGMPGKVSAHLFARHAPVRFGGRPDLLDASAGCGAGGAPASRATYHANRARMQRLAHFSRERLHELTRAAAARLRARRRLSRAAALADATWRWREPGIAPWPSSAQRSQLLDAAALPRRSSPA